MQTVMISDWQILAYLFVSVLFGGCIGLEREFYRKAAGLRTHMLVSGTSCMLMFLGILITQEFRGFAPQPAYRSDPIGILQAMIVGVSFIGAGTIFKGQGNDGPKNLTTAASILYTSVIGMVTATGRLGLSFGMTMLGLFINLALGIVERRVRQDDREEQ